MQKEAKRIITLILCLILILLIINSLSYNSNAIFNFFKKPVTKQINQISTQQVTLNGKIIVEHADDFQNSKSINKYYLIKQDNTKIELQGKVDPNLVNNQVNILGTFDNNKFTISSINPVSKETYPLPLGNQRWAVILVNFADDRREFITKEHLQDDLLPEIKDFVRENSYNKLILDFDVYGWYHLNSNSVCGFNIGNILNDQPDQDINYRNYYGVVIIYPSPDCGFDGINLGFSLHNTNDGNVILGTIGMPSRAFRINDDYSQNVIEHELGHIFSAYHSNFLNCLDKSILEDVGYCNSEEYQDHFDVMGKGINLHYNGVWKEKFEWLNQNNIQTITSNGIYTITPLEMPNGIKILKIPRGRDRSTNEVFDNLYLEYRQPIGFDSGLLGDKVTKGILIHYSSVRANLVRSSLLIDITPTIPDSKLDPALLPGNVFIDTTANVIIKVLSVNQNSATVEIKFICQDQTPFNQCSLNKPLYCSHSDITKTSNLINKCSMCGCPNGFKCGNDGSCTSINPPPPIIN